MKKFLFVLACTGSLFLSCKKNDSGDDGNGGGGGGGGNAPERYIIRIPGMCPVGTNYHLGFSLAGNLIDYQLAMTISDTLNSWYLQKLSNNNYLVYAKLGNQFLVWKEGPPQSFLIVYTVNQVLLEQVSTLPLTNTPDGMQFKIEKDPVTEEWTITAKSGLQFTPYKGGKKLATGHECTISGLPLLNNMNNCIDRDEFGKIVQYCFLKKFLLQKLN